MWQRSEKNTNLQREPDEGGSIPKGVADDDGGKLLGHQAIEATPGEAADKSSHDEHEVS